MRVEIRISSFRVAELSPRFLAMDDSQFNKELTRLRLLSDAFSGSTRYRLRSIHDELEKCWSEASSSRGTQDDVLCQPIRRISLLEDRVISRLATMESDLKHIKANVSKCQGPLRSGSADFPTQGLDSTSAMNSAPVDPLNGTGTVAFMNRCPSFINFPILSTFESLRRGAGLHQGATVKWGKVVEWTPFTRDVPTWVAASNIWTRYILRPNVDKTLYELRCRCKLGGNVVKYRREVESGLRKVKEPFTRGFADRENPFAPCPCELKIKYCPNRYIFSIEISLNEEGGSHTHPDLHPDTKAICSNLIKIDPSLIVHNSMTNVAKIPGTALKPSMMATVCNDEIMASAMVDRPYIQRQLASKKTKRSIQRLCRKLRGERTRLHLGHLQEMKRKCQRDFRRLSIRDPYAAEHEPRIIGLDSKIKDTGELEQLVLTISTSAMLKFACEYQTRFTFCCDGTYKRVTSDYPLIVCGMTTPHNHFQPISISFVLKETTYAYGKVFSHVKNTVPCEFHPCFAMADAACMIANAMEKEFPRTKILTCYAHMMRAVNKYIRYQCGMRDVRDWIAIRKSIRSLALTHNRFDFQAGVAALAEKYSSNRTFVSYLQKSRGYFDLDNWRSCWRRFPYGSLDSAWTPRTNNALESFNYRIKREVCSNQMLPFPDLLQALLGGIFRKFSTECLLSASQQNMENFASKKKILSAFSAVEFARGGNVYSELGIHSANAETFEGVWTVLLDTAAEDNSNLVYLPANMELTYEHPNLGGSFCFCEDFVEKNCCAHVRALLGADNQPETSEVPIDSPTTREEPIRVGRPTPNNGLTRPRRVLPALHRHVF
jgi:hypothetical protein